MNQIIKSIMAIFMVFLLMMAFTGSAIAIKENPTDKKSVIIMFKDEPDSDLIKYHGGDIKTVYHIKPAIAASIPQKAIDALNRNPKIDYIVNDLEIFTVDETLPWGVERIGADDVHDYPNPNRGGGVNIAIIDTGIDYSHPDLMANYIDGYDFAGTSSKDQNDEDNDPMDVNGHGTHVAGTVAALDNEIGVIGVAPEANLYILKVFADDGPGNYSDVIEALEWCIGTRNDTETENDIQVISMSIGSSGDPKIEPWINAAYEAGILLVGAAGNDGNWRGTGDNVIYPARYDNVIAVAATYSNDNRAFFSSTGPDVELAAPGYSIYSTVLNDDYGYKSGTSMACPHVTGTAALVIASGIIDENENGNINDEVRTRLIDTAIDLGSEGRDTWYGYGLVDAEAATASMVTLESIAVTPMDASIPKGLTQQYTAIGTYSDSSTADITSSVTWTSSNTTVANIDSEGSATGVGDGSTDIKATLGSIESNIATLTVTAPILQSITVTSDTATIEVDATQQYLAEGTYSDASIADITSSVTWASSNAEVATFDSPAGLATGVGAGTTTITASSNSINDTATLTVTLALKSIAITPETASIPKGLTQQYTATGTYSDASTADITSSVTWTSSNTAVANIDSAGSATGVGDGITDIKATLGSIESNVATLTVTAPSEPTVSVKSITYSTEGGRDGNKHLSITVALVDDSSNSVADASVSIEVDLDDKFYVSSTGTTGTEGTVTFKFPNALYGTYTTEVIGVIAGELEWDGFTPLNEHTKE